ncbi:methylated-DNA--[protein]-cysteine S-methyltransferase [Corynebacterium choanae]|uniref:methylated-DNA--[protein]-cysteine S-methyltransferase n=1 Tax=Corynebacterium choanae TaxID=1862358 RepID=A0A3G6JDB8_9CORY|nr:methylated-DNA--[protein]-cysteine S-methyltransferase [Corynebacterium choanae]AZA14660.1 Methylated-DNA--protein-cysteine methyltransferase [Corynebacterium choanae]
MSNTTAVNTAPLCCAEDTWAADLVILPFAPVLVRCCAHGIQHVEILTLPDPDPVETSDSENTAEQGAPATGLVTNDDPDAVGNETDPELAPAEPTEPVPYVLRSAGTRLAAAHCRMLCKQLQRYARGTLQRFTVPIAPAVWQQATPFRRQVWHTLYEQVPFGATVTYGEVSQLLRGNERASRAVGGAVGANKIAIVIPCHRVVGANGIGGYAYDVAVKRALLALEGGTEHQV